MVLENLNNFRSGAEIVKTSRNVHTERNFGFNKAKTARKNVFYGLKIGAHCGKKRVSSAVGSQKTKFQPHTFFREILTVSLRVTILVKSFPKGFQQKYFGTKRNIPRVKKWHIMLHRFCHVLVTNGARVCHPKWVERNLETRKFTVKVPNRAIGSGLESLEFRRFLAFLRRVFAKRYM